VLLVIVAAAAAVLLLGPDRQLASSESSAARSALADLQITQLTTSGTAERPAISPDGRYVAYVQRDGNAFSLWLRQTTTTSNVQIVAPESGVTLYGATFTPDATSVDYVRQPNGAPADIWRVPFLGGTPRRFISDVGEQHLVGAGRSTPRILAHSLRAYADDGTDRRGAGWRPGTHSGIA
jgi:Tol biopolymer transport system component